MRAKDVWRLPLPALHGGEGILPQHRGKHAASVAALFRPGPRARQRQRGAHLGASRPLHRGRGAHRRMGRAPPRHACALRVRPLRHQAGLGVPVRRADAGAADRYPPPLPQGCLARPLRLPRPRRRRHPGRHARLQARDVGGGEGDPRLPRHRHGDGDLQDRDGIVDLSRGVAAAHRRRAAVHRLHVRGHRLLHRAMLAPVRLPVHAPPAAVGALCCWPRASTSTSSPTTICPTRASPCSR